MATRSARSTVFTRLSFEQHVPQRHRQGSPFRSTGPVSIGICGLAHAPSDPSRRRSLRTSSAGGTCTVRRWGKLGCSLSGTPFAGWTGELGAGLDLCDGWKIRRRSTTTAPSPTRPKPYSSSPRGRLAVLRPVRSQRQPGSAHRRNRVARYPGHGLRERTGRTRLCPSGGGQFPGSQAAYQADGKACSG